MFELTVAADVGSAFTRMASRRNVITEETRAALDPNDGKRVLAFGSGAARLLNVTNVYPVRGGISDVSLTAMMLRRFALGLLGRKSLVGVGLRLAMPFSAKDTELSAAFDVGREAGFARTRLEDCMAAGAEGAGVDINGPSAKLVVNIGRERTCTAVFANGGTLAERTAAFGSSEIDRRLQAFFAIKHGVLVTGHTAERIKKELGLPAVRVNGRDPATGCMLMRSFAAAELREAAEPAVKRLAAEIASVFGAVSPDAAADLYDNGAVLIGGGANMYGLAESLEEKLGMPVRTARNSADAVILGLRQGLERGAKNAAQGFIPCAANADSF